MAAHPSGSPSGPGRDGTRRTTLLTERHLLDYVRVLVKRRWTALPTLAIVLAAAAYVSFTATPMYEARVQLLIEADAQKVISFQEVVQQAQATSDFYQTQYRILQSRTLAKAAIDALDLWKHKEFTDPPRSPFAPRALAARVRETITAATDRVLGRSAPAGAAGKPAPPSEGSVLDAFAARLTVAPVRNSRLVDVKFRATDPRLAAEVANVLADAYIRQDAEYKFQAAKQATDWLTQQLTQQRGQVEQTELALQRYREQHGNVATDDAQNIVVQKLSDLNAAVTKAKTERLQREAAYQQVTAIEHDRAALASFPAVLTNPHVQTLQAEVATAERAATKLAEELGDRHPDLARARDEVTAVRHRLDAAIDSVVRAVRDEYVTAQDNEQRLVDALEAQKREVLALNRKEIGYRALERDAVSNRQIFESLLQRAKETGISSELKTNDIRVADRAAVPRSPIHPRIRRTMALALLAGTLLAIAAAFGAEYLDNKIKSPDEIASHLGLPCLGLVPEVPKKRHAGQPLLNNGVPAMFAEAFRVVRSNLLFSSPGVEGGRTLVVTSSGPGEGKTLVSTNLAIGLALVGRRVLLVDADLRRPQVHSALSCPQAPGMAEVLDEKSDPATAIRPGPVPNLSVLPSGELPDNPAEMLSSTRCRRLIERLTQSYDFVVIDSPPVMPVTDAAVLANLASGVVFVVGAEVVACPTIMKALEQLDASHARYVGAVLNRVELARNSFFYSPYYRRDYGKYYGAVSRG